MTEVDSSHSAPPPAFVPEAGDTTEGPRVSGLESTLEENLCALLGESTREQLVQRILWAENGKHVIIGGPNPPLYRAQGKLREFVVDGDDLEESVRDVRDGETVFVFGISLGEQAAHILRTRPNCMVIAWERDPWLMRLALTRQDYWKSLSTGRLQLALGADLLDHVPHLHEYRLVLHPVLRGIYTDELRLVSESVSGETPSEGRRWIGVGMGGVVVTDLADALRSEGYTVFPLELQRWEPRETRLALERLRPEYVITTPTRQRRATNSTFRSSRGRSTPRRTARPARRRRRRRSTSSRCARATWRSCARQASPRSSTSRSAWTSRSDARWSSRARSPAATPRR